MKKIFAVAILALSTVAHAQGTIFAGTSNQSGGMNYLVQDDGTQCPATGVGFVASVPFKGYTRGCVTKFDKNSGEFTVYLETGETITNNMSGYTPIESPTKKAKAKSTL